MSKGDQGMLIELETKHVQCAHLELRWSPELIQSSLQ